MLTLTIMMGPKSSGGLNPVTCLASPSNFSICAFNALNAGQIEIFSARAQLITEPNRRHCHSKELKSLTSITATPVPKASLFYLIKMGPLWVLFHVSLFYGRLKIEKKAGYCDDVTFFILIEMDL